MSTESSLRRAISDDIPAIASLFIETRTRCRPYIVWDYSQAVMEEVFAFQMKEMETWLADVDGQLAGFIGFVPDEIEHLYLLPEFHRQGIGTKLLRQALDRCGDEVSLWVFQQNRSARTFYERHGFLLQLETDGSGNMEKVPDARYLWRRPSNR